MNIGIVDVDGHNFPNLALMKISGYHKSRGDNVEFATMFEHYDVIYKSKVFSWTPDDEYFYNTDNIIEGGTGYGIYNKLDGQIDDTFPDYKLYNCQHAYGFLTRGCPNKCAWCIVPKKEGGIKPYADIDDFIGDFSSAILMDNNVLASEHGINQIEKIIERKIKVDFNQGLDARLIDDGVARLLSRVRWLSPVRLSCDTGGIMPYVERAVGILRKNKVTPSRYFCYVLVKDVRSALERVEFLRELNVDPFAQSYRDINNTMPTREQKNFCRWVNHKAIFKSVSYDEYIGRVP